MPVLTAPTTDTPDPLATEIQRPPQPEEPEHLAVVRRQMRMERAILAVLLLLYFVSATGFALVTPYGEAPDENGHMLYVDHIVRFGTFPEIKAHPHAYEAIQPPLYYIIGAGFVTFGRVATGKRLDLPLAPRMRHNPEHGVDPAVVQVLLHPPEERWPVTVYMLRGLAILMGAGVILLTYATARALVPRPAPPWAALLAAGFAALIPQIQLHSRQRLQRKPGSPHGRAPRVAPDALPDPALQRASGDVDRDSLRAGGAVETIAGPAHPAGAVGIVGAARRGLAALTGAIAGWLFIHRWVAYGDPLAQAAAHEMLPPHSSFCLEQFFWFDEPFRSMLWTSFWGTFGWQSIWSPDWVYHAALGLTLLAIGGGVYLLIRRAFTHAQAHACAMMLMVMLLAYAVVIVVSTDQIIWQGREMFPALSSICTLLGLGLAGALAGRRAVQPQPTEMDGRRWRQWMMAGATTALIAGLFALNLYSVLWLVLPALNS